MSPYLQRLMKLHRLMDESGSDDGSGHGTGGGGENKSDDKYDKSGTDGTKNDDSGTPKVTDAEAKLLKEVMDKKTKLKEASDKLAQVNAQLAQFDGIDPVAIRKMLEDQKTAEQKKLEAAGQWDALKKQMNDAFDADKKALTTAKEEADQRAAAKDAKIAELTVGNAFAQSKFISEEVALTPAKARIIYGSHFEYSDDGVVAFDKPAGSASRTMLVDGKGEPLAFDVALRKIIEIDPDRDQMLKSKAKVGAGSRTDSKAAAPKGAVDISSRDKIKAGLANLKPAR
jgi:hypothetical protein